MHKNADGWNRREGDELIRIDSMAAGRGLIHGLVISGQSKSDARASIVSDNDDEFFRSIRHRSPTLVDIMRQEQKMAGTRSGSLRNPDDGSMNWRSFKDRLLLRRTAAALSRPPSPKPRENIPGAFFSRCRSVRLPEESGGGGGKTSLMSLFENGGAFDDDDDGDEEEEEEFGEEDEEEEDGEGVVYTSCCVCMVRHKCGALATCGHNFCKLCAKQTWIGKGKCALCNGFILEILNIW